METLAARKQPFRTMLRYGRRYSGPYAIGAVLSLFYSCFDLTQPLLVRFIMHGIEIGTLTRTMLLLAFSGMIVASIGSGIMRYYQRLLMIGASRHIEYDLRNDLFRRLLLLSPAYFQRTKTGDILARAANDLNQVREFLGPGVMGSVDMLRIPFTLGLMIWFSPWLTLMALIPLPFISLLVFVFMRFLNRQSKIVQTIFGEVSNKVQENLAGARVVRAYGIGARESRDFHTVSEKYMRANIKLVAIMSTAIPILGVLAGSIIMLLIWQGGESVMQGRLSLADFSGFLVCNLMIVFPLAQLGWVLTLYQRGAAGMDRMSGILTETPEIRDTEETNPTARVADGAIEFEDVQFDYGQGPVLEHLSFTIPAGQTFALVGPTGSGKTSVISLLTRGYDPKGGRVVIDGNDARSIPVRELREAIACVPQDVFIFSDTIAANLRMGRESLSEEDLWRACEIAQLADTLRQMPEGLNTLLGERGINLSGGQKQRLTLARAVAGNPKILVLDDALSSVDTHTEEQILRGLRGVMAERTSLIVSHRISTVRHADRVLVLDGGRLAEEGTHDELIARDGLYADMHRRQLLEDALEEDEPEAAPA